mgnify:CR=1 FL=1
MMSRDQIGQTIQRASEKCAESGTKLTDKRIQFLDLMLQADAPLSVYEILDRYNANSAKSMPPMSAYRILAFLESEQLVHKLSSENKYVACAHIMCCPEHKISQFLICRSCHKVEEIAIAHDIIDSLKQSVAEANYHLMNSQLELDCLCGDCLNDVE